MMKSLLLAALDGHKIHEDHALACVCIQAVMHLLTWGAIAQSHMVFTHVLAHNVVWR